MQPTKEINTPLHQDAQSITLSQQISQWLGRFWRFCVNSLASPLFNLFKRVNGIACFHFSTPSEQPNRPTNSVPHSFSPKPSSPINKKIEKMTKQTENQEVKEEVVIDLNTLFAQDSFQPGTPSQTEESIKNKAPIHGNDFPDNSGEPAESKAKNSATIEPFPPEVKATNKEPTPPNSKVEPKKVTRERFKRRKGLQNTPIFTSNSHSELSSATTPSTAVPSKSPSSRSTTIKPSSPPKPKPIIIDNEGKGNCQLLSILKGLEMQYPNLLEYEENGKKTPLTAQKLREIGVEFIREQIDKCGPYVTEILGYVDTDRKEHNQAEIDPIEKRMNDELKKIESAFKNKKISKTVYENQKKAHQDKYSKIITYLEDNVIIKTDEEFLNRLAKDGFYCSTLHLFALSIKLDLPIHVHEQAGVKNHNIQMFNPRESHKTPLHLYRVGNIHYKYILFPEIAEKA